MDSQTEGGPIFKFSDYDCIGFDLDNTLARYKVGALIEMEYEILSKFLVEKKGYSAEFLLQPFDHNFIIKGLFVDFENGNLLRIAPDGKILQAAHGTKFLNEQDILKYYPNGHWELSEIYIKNPLETWNGPYSERIRTLLDYFDITYSLLFARIIDSFEVNNNDFKSYNIFKDLLEALSDMFNTDNFKNDGKFYALLKQYPEKYYYKCSESLINWLKDLKSSGKLLFVITGSHVDFASHTANYTLGTNWKELFDITVCFAKKPGFFTSDREFFGVEQFNEVGPTNELKIGQIYTRGNWTDLEKCLKAKSNKQNPKFLYVGDNLVQDIYAPKQFSKCDTVTICEELEAEGVHGHSQWHPDEQFLVSTIWGSYFHCKTTNKVTIWYDIMKKYSKLCVPSVEYVANFPIHHKFDANNSF